MYYLIGGAGVPNYGDELMMRMWLDRILQAVPATSLVASGIWLNVLNDQFSENYSGVHFSNYVHKQIRSHNDDYSEALNRGYVFLKSNPNNSIELEKLLSSKVFHLHGGGYLNTMWPRHAFLLGLALALKELTDCKLYATGLGLTPAPKLTGSAQRLLQEAMTAFEFMEVRDSPSYDFAKENAPEANIIHGLDDTFLEPFKSSNTSTKILRISLFPNKDAKLVIERIKEKFVNNFDEVHFWCCANHDVEMFNLFSKRFPQTSLIQNKELIFTPPCVGRDDFMVTSRFHPHLIVSRSGGSGSYRAESEYYEVKHGSIIDMGSSFRMSRIPNLVSTRNREKTFIEINEKNRVLEKNKLINTIFKGYPKTPTIEGNNKNLVRISSLYKKIKEKFL